MNTTSLVAEFILIGFIPFLSIVFGVLAANRIYDLSFLSQAKDYSAIIVFTATMFIYLLGALTHRLTQVINQYLWKPMLDLLPRHNEPSSKDAKAWYDRFTLIYQFGSEKLIDRIQYNDSLIRIFGATLTSLPILAGSFSFWIYGAAGWRAVIIALVGCAILEIATFLSYRMQKENHSLWLASAKELISKTRKNKEAK